MHQVVSDARIDSTSARQRDVDFNRSLRGSHGGDLQQSMRQPRISRSPLRLAGCTLSLREIRSCCAASASK
jgi:hypothetical protein